MCKVRYLYLLYHNFTNVNESSCFINISYILLYYFYAPHLIIQAKHIVIFNLLSRILLLFTLSEKLTTKETFVILTFMKMSVSTKYDYSLTHISVCSKLTKFNDNVLNRAITVQYNNFNSTIRLKMKRKKKIVVYV